MIAPLRYPLPAAETPLPGPRHIGQLLPQILARYGIVMSAAELAALSPSTPEKAAAPLRPSKLSSRRFRGRSSEPAASGHHNMVQLPLFPSANRSTASGMAVH